ncbi:hypothetical protein K402DRAFT_4180 [Aulographum hederae CBS 113979]|uniref:Uncharacterized protein n=1 Tax=Aulographum hederae CBS 113979 TaxID=1176131 RepID=A0A6G1HGI7_9PEZI|nr:hypothetical protein K402DRAFT_4180 [Aulographum hederae CBS 113979]
MPPHSIHPLRNALTALWTSTLPPPAGLGGFERSFNIQAIVHILLKVLVAAATGLGPRHSDQHDTSSPFSDLELLLVIRFLQDWDAFEHDTMLEYRTLLDFVKALLGVSI